MDHNIPTTWRWTHGDWWYGKEIRNKRKKYVLLVQHNLFHQYILCFFVIVGYKKKKLNPTHSSNWLFCFWIYKTKQNKITHMKTKFSRTVPTMAWHVQKTKMSEYVTQHFDTKRNWILTEEPLRKFPIASTADRIHLNVLLECSVSTPFFRSIRGSATSCTKSALTEFAY